MRYVWAPFLVELNSSSAYDFLHLFPFLFLFLDYPLESLQGLTLPELQNRFQTLGVKYQRNMSKKEAHNRLKGLQLSNHPVNELLGLLGTLDLDNLYNNMKVKSKNVANLLWKLVSGPDGSQIQPIHRLVSILSSIGSPAMGSAVPLQNQPLPKCFDGLPLQNGLGENLCYINSTINALGNCATFDGKILASDVQSSPLLKELHQLLSGQSKSTNNLRKMVGKDNPAFANTDQQDAHDFFMALLKTLPGLANLFQFTSKQTATCLKCNFLTEMPDATDTTFGVQTNAPNIGSLVDSELVRQISKKCICSENDQLHEFRTTITSSSDLFFIQTGRCSDDRSNWNPVFLEHVEIEPSKHLRLGNDTFELRSVIIKSGAGVKSGHYTCAIQSRGKWIMCNDMNTHETSVPLSGYLFLYEKVGKDLETLDRQPFILPASTPPMPVPCTSAFNEGTPYEKTNLQANQLRPTVSKPAHSEFRWGHRENFWVAKILI